MAQDKKKTAVTDLLEAAKIASKPPPAPPATPPPPPELALPTGTVEPLAPPFKRYRVATTTTVSLGGQLVRLSVGDVLSEADYGPKSMAIILSSNVALTEVE